MTDETGYKIVLPRTCTRLPVRGVDYAVSEWGDADAPLLFYLHGWADTGATFQFVVDALTPRWRVIAPDWRGFGASALRAQGYWFPDYLADLHALLLHYAPDAAVPLVGHSMGANIASLYAGTVPERVSAFVNVEGFGLPDSDPAEAPFRYRSWIEAEHEDSGFSTYASFDALAKRIAKRSPEIGADRALYVAHEWAQQSEDGRIRLRADSAHRLPNPVLYRRAEAEACWCNIAADILLVSGGRSRFAEQFGSAASLPFPRSESRVIDGAGHMIHFEAPVALAGLIEDFLT
ncbi:MAG: alpha/beta hydrolase [Gammaproteobacteria bacterium]|nr:alpha/beta hydrolase [Gammaproteobacteria bacterium]